MRENKNVPGLPPKARWNANGEGFARSDLIFGFRSFEGSLRRAGRKARATFPLAVQEPRGGHRNLEGDIVSCDRVLGKRGKSSLLSPPIRRWRSTMSPSASPDLHPPIYWASGGLRRREDAFLDQPPAEFNTITQISPPFLIRDRFAKEPEIPPL